MIMITKKNRKSSMTMIIFSFIFAMILSLLLQIHLVYGLEMDVKCTIYENSDDDENGGTVDVRILVLGLKANNDYTAEVIPDHNPPTSITATTDYEGIFWAVAKIPNGEKSLLFNVNVYEGNDIDGEVITSGDDDTPCHPLPLFDK